jgi:hypothetical protein
MAAPKKQKSKSAGSEPSNRKPGAYARSKTSV